MTQYTLGLTRLLGAGRAFTELLPVPSPAAAVGFTYTNTGLYWELLDSISFQLLTDSNADDRQVTLQILDGGGIALATLPAASVQAASLTYQYTFSPEFSNFNTVVGTAITAPLPLIFLQPDFSVKVAFSNAHVGDKLTHIRFYAERFQTGASGYLRGTVDIDDPVLDDALTLDQVRR